MEIGIYFSWSKQETNLIFGKFIKFGVESILNLHYLNLWFERYGHLKTGGVSGYRNDDSESFLRSTRGPRNNTGSVHRHDSPRTRSTPETMERPD